MANWHLMFLIGCFILASTLAAPPKKAAKQEKKGFRCMTCRAQGKECQSDKGIVPCDKCYKFTGTVDDPNQVPSWVWSVLGPDAKRDMSANKGKETTLRGCATQELIDVATLGENYEDTGCSDMGDFYGFRNAHACLCNGDCSKS